MFFTNNKKRYMHVSSLFEEGAAGPIEADFCSKYLFFISPLDFSSSLGILRKSHLGSDDELCARRNIFFSWHHHFLNALFFGEKKRIERERGS